MLSRDVLKWLQSLDLSFSIKNTRRDFANGFLLAEILSRYFRADVQMHSFSSGHSTAQKAANWKLLDDFFTRASLPPLKKALLQDVMLAQPDAADQLISQVYVLLTQKTIPHTRATKMTTTQHLLDDVISLEDRDKQKSEALKRSELPQGKKKSSKHSGTESQSLKPGQSPVRNSGASTRNVKLKISRVSNRVVCSDNTFQSKINSAAKVVVKNIEKGTNSHRSNISSLRSDTAGNISPFVSTHGTINTILQDVMKQKSCKISAVDKDINTVDSFFDATAYLDDELVTEVIDACVSECSHALAQTCIGNPKEFWRLMSYVITVLNSCPEQSQSFTSVLNLLRKVGEEMLEIDSSLPFSLFQDFALPQFAEMIRWKPRKRHYLVQALFSFVKKSSTERIKVKRKLQEALKDNEVFSACLASLSILEKNNFFDASLDSYLYYSLVGLRSSVSLIRAAALSTLTNIVAHPKGKMAVLTQLERIETLIEDEWWQVQINLIELACALLSQLHCSHTSVNQIYLLIQSVLHPSANQSVVQLGLRSVAAIMHSHECMQQFFLSCCLQNVMVTELLMLSSASKCIQQIIPVGAFGPIFTPCADSLWNALSVVQGISKQLQESNAIQLTPICWKLLIHSWGNKLAFEEQEIEQWQLVLSDLIQFVVCGITSGEKTYEAFVLLKKIVNDARMETLTRSKLFEFDSEGTESELAMALHQVFKNNNPICCVQAIRFLEVALFTPSSYDSSIAELVSNLLERAPKSFTTASELQDLLSRYETEIQQRERTELKEH